jgi:uncharacterized protein YgiB involved in biofilm formation
MKRSVVVSLVIMGAASTLAACEDTTIKSSVFSTVDECSISTDYSRERCEQDYAEAKKAHEKYAPAFNSQTDCEAEFGAGKCEPAKTENAASAASSGSHSSFVPLMMGYMMGSRIGETNRSMAPQALYKPSNGSNFVKWRVCRKQGWTRDYVWSFGCCSRTSYTYQDACTWRVWFAFNEFCRLIDEKNCIRRAV